MEATKKPSPVTFHVFRKDGSKNPDIKLSFLEDMTISVHDIPKGHITLVDGTIWELVMEAPVKEAFKKQTEVKCLISFQARVNGNYAVCRLFDETKSKQRKGANSNG